MDTTVVLNGLTHPHSEMYLETLEALDEVGGVVFVDADDASRAASAAKTSKLRGSHATLEAALRQPGAPAPRGGSNRDPPMARVH